MQLVVVFNHEALKQERSVGPGPVESRYIDPEPEMFGRQLDDCLRCDVSFNAAFAQSDDRATITGRALRPERWLAKTNQAEPKSGKL
jgi:hypothetical protein